jgi:hypothetical protein
MKEKVFGEEASRVDKFTDSVATVKVLDLTPSLIGIVQIRGTSTVHFNQLSKKWMSLSTKE